MHTVKLVAEGPPGNLVRVGVCFWPRGQAGARHGQAKETAGISRLRDETAADANGVLSELTCPEGFQTDPDRRKNGNVKNSKQCRGDFLLSWEIQGHSAESEIYHPSATGGLIAED